MFFCLVPTQFTVFPQNVQVNEANPIVLSCDASGFPEPSFAWMKDGQVVSKSKQLNIQSDRSSSGIYVCTASNGVGNVQTAKAYVTVQCKSITQAVYPYSYSRLEVAKSRKYLKYNIPRVKSGMKL